MIDLFHVMGFICLTGHKIDMVFDDDDYEKNLCWWSNLQLVANSNVAPA